MTTAQEIAARRIRRFAGLLAGDPENKEIVEALNMGAQALEMSSKREALPIISAEIVSELRLELGKALHDRERYQKRIRLERGRNEILAREFHRLQFEIRNLNVALVAAEVALLHGEQGRQEAAGAGECKAGPDGTESRGAEIPAGYEAGSGL